MWKLNDNKTDICTLKGSCLYVLIKYTRKSVAPKIKISYLKLCGTSFWIKEVIKGGVIGVRNIINEISERSLMKAKKKEKKMGDRAKQWSTPTIDRLKEWTAVVYNSLSKMAGRKLESLQREMDKYRDREV